MSAPQSGHVPHARQQQPVGRGQRDRGRDAGGGKDARGVVGEGRDIGKGAVADGLPPLAEIRAIQHETGDDAEIARRDLTLIALARDQGVDVAFQKIDRGVVRFSLDRCAKHGDGDGQG